MTSRPRSVMPLPSPVDAAVQVPGSKSLSNRALLLAAMAKGTSHLRGILESDDTNALVAALETFGATITRDADVVSITGVDSLRPDIGTIDMGAGGTPARFVLALASLTEGPVSIDGSPRLRERPMSELIGMLTDLGAHIEPLGKPGHLPVRVHPGRIKGGRIDVAAQASSQFVSALMLIAPHIHDGIELNFTDVPTSEAYIRLTISELKAWGVDVTVIEDADGHLRNIRVSPGDIKAIDRRIPADASSALYWASLATIILGSRIELIGLDPTDGQPDHQAIAALGRIGLGLERIGDRIICINPGHQHEGWGDLDASMMPDGAMALAIVASCASDATRLTGLETLRVKECDRVEALATELTRTGAKVVIEGDDLVIHPQTDLTETATPSRIETYDDHRMAMAFAVLGLRQGGISIEDPSCVAKSYPGFWEDLMKVESTASRRDTP
ncbi:MAG: 3-phosphoshikimate 1-carboxyvinyltransferase [Phycisphaerales bacterium]|nr:3-phosphoshikimate 1-carboxyvinyltransferase [Phycisphaerales bacterium]